MHKGVTHWDMKQEKEYTCVYSHCLHHGEKVKASESVVISKKHYHWDCAELKQKINECANLYIEHGGDKTLYPAAIKIINNLVFSNKVPVDYIFKHINASGDYYKNKPVYILYGLRKLFYEYEFVK